jgi:Domain of unknown function (DUF4124)
MLLGALLSLALLAPPAQAPVGAAQKNVKPEQKPQTYYWKDAGGQTHITNSPPPPDATLIDMPSVTAIERETRILPIRQSAGRKNTDLPDLSPAQQVAWKNLEQLIVDARSQRDIKRLESVIELLIHEYRWSDGLWAMPMLPLAALAVLCLLGWWVALGLKRDLRWPVISLFGLAGLMLAHVMLSAFVWRPQCLRLRVNLTVLERHLGEDKTISDAHRRELQARYKALEESSYPTALPWSFPAAVDDLEATMKHVVIEP